MPSASIDDTDMGRLAGQGRETAGQGREPESGNSPSMAISAPAPDAAIGLDDAIGAAVDAVEMEIEDDAGAAQMVC